MTLTQWWEIIGWILYAAIFAGPAWAIGYRQGYIVGLTDGHSRARRLADKEQR